MMNKSEAGCCGRGEGVKAEEHAAAATTHGKGGCGCEGSGRKAEARDTGPVVAEAAAADTTVKSERKRGCC